MNSKGKLLIVDDHEKNREIVRFNLGDLDGYDIIEADNGKTGLKTALHHHPDVILLDIMMPVMDGYEMLQCLKSDPVLKGIPVLMITAKASTENVVKALDLGAQDYIVKPFDVEELSARVKTLVKLKKSEDKLKRSITLLEHEAVLGQLTAGTIHDLNNIMGGMQAYELIQMRLESALKKFPDPDIQKEFRSVLSLCDLIGESVELGKVICENLHSFSRGIAAGRHRQSLDDLITIPLKIFERRFRTRGISLNSNLEKVPLFDCNAGEIQRVILNLVTNSVHAMEESERRELTVNLKLEQNHILIEVKDTGCGVPPKHREQIFEKFFTTKEEGVGSGIGLHQVASIVESYSGTVNFNSGPDGTCFQVRLPVVGQEDA
jgi:signal transduction histidine kinase